jgi:Ca2+-binding RTX toxin-like protein
VAYIENASAIALDNSVAIVDAELAALNGGAGNYAGASVTLARHGGADARDLFSALGNLSFSASNVVLSGTTIGTLSNSAGTLVITFDSGATQAVVDQVLSSIGYASSSDAPTATVQVDWTFSDGNTIGSQGSGGVLTGTGSSTVNITAVNDAPTGNVTITGIGELGKTLAASDTLADADGLGTISYQWQANGVNINGATDATYTLRAAEIGQQVTVQASYTDSGGTQESATSGGVQIASYTNTLAENTKLVTTVTSSDVLLGSAPKFTLSGEDAAAFNISNKGVLTLKVVPDFEAPIDANHDGAYKVDVTLTNAKTHYAVTQNMVVGVNFAEIDGTAGADALKGTKGWDTLDGKAGDDLLSGGDGLDTFIISAGHDTVKDFNVLGKTWTGPGAEVLQVAAGASVSATLKAAWSATSDTFNFGDALITTSGLAVDLSGVTTGLGWDVLNKGKATTLTGSMFDDTLTAGSGNDVLQGGAGNDTLIGGKLADTMTGGTGSDIFQLNGLKGIATAHHITDFVSGQDHIQLDSKIFKALGIGALSDSAWVDGTTATNSNQHILYNSSNGELFYDVDGSGKKAAVLIGVVDNHAALTHGDFMVV